MSPQGQHFGDGAEASLWGRVRLCRFRHKRTRPQSDAPQGDALTGGAGGEDALEVRDDLGGRFLDGFAVRTHHEASQVPIE